MKTFGGLSRQDLRKWLVGHALPPADMMVVAQELFEELERAERERDANKEDAERYRWLRINSVRPAEPWSTHEAPESLDAAIDAAREGK